MFKFILCFVRWISQDFFHHLSSTNMLCFLLFYSIRFFHALLLFLCRISTVLSQGISYGMWLFAWKFLLFFSVRTSFRVHASFSGYNYYNYVVVVSKTTRLSWFTQILFWIGLLLSEEVKQLKVIINMQRMYTMSQRMLAHLFRWTLSWLHRT